jgi:hypothetical protein
MGWQNSRWSTAPEEVSILGSMSLHVWLPGLKRSPFKSPWCNNRSSFNGFFSFEDRCSHYSFAILIIECSLRNATLLPVNIHRIYMDLLRCWFTFKECKPQLNLRMPCLTVSLSGTLGFSASRWEVPYVQFLRP